MTRSHSRLFAMLATAGLALLLTAPEASWAQGRDRGGDRGGDQRQRMAEFFMQMRSGGSSGGDRGEQMRAMFSRARESSRDGGSRWGGFGDRSRGDRSRGDRSRGDRGRGSRRVEKKPRPRVTVDLPESFKAQDRDLDGQIGLYEWKRSAIASFRVLDLNNDGFLTPRELQAGEATASTSESSSSEPAGDSGSTAAAAVPAETVAVSATTATAKKPASRNERMARYVFKALDKDKDGTLTSKEWTASERTRATFKKKGVKLKLPTDIEKFVAVYPAR